MVMSNANFKPNLRSRIRAELPVCLYCPARAQKMASPHLFLPSTAYDTSVFLSHLNWRLSGQLILHGYQPLSHHSIPIDPVFSTRFSPIHF